MAQVVCHFDRLVVSSQCYVDSVPGITILPDYLLLFPLIQTQYSGCHCILPFPPLNCLSVPALPSFPITTTLIQTCHYCKGAQLIFSFQSQLSLIPLGYLYQSSVPKALLFLWYPNSITQICSLLPFFKTHPNGHVLLPSNQDSDLSQRAPWTPQLEIPCLSLLHSFSYVFLPTSDFLGTLCLIMSSKTNNSPSMSPNQFSPSSHSLFPQLMLANTLLQYLLQCAITVHSQDYVSHSIISPLMTERTLSCSTL